VLRDASVTTLWSLSSAGLLQEENSGVLPRARGRRRRPSDHTRPRRRAARPIRGQRQTRRASGGSHAPRRRRGERRRPASRSGLNFTTSGRTSTSFFSVKLLLFSWPREVRCAHKLFRDFKGFFMFSGTKYVKQGSYGHGKPGKIMESLWLIFLMVISRPGKVFEIQ